jgi:hypothetical protein
MPLTQTYHDAYLSHLVTQDREDRATSDVADEGAFPASWTSRLIVLRAYIITCQESMKMADDTFDTKLKAYRGEYKDALVSARLAQAAAVAAAGGPSAPAGGGSFFTVDLVRG